MLHGAPTPRIDHPAAEDLRLLNFNVKAQCTPGNPESRSPVDFEFDEAVWSPRTADEVLWTLQSYFPQGMPVKLRLPWSRSRFIQGRKGAMPW